MFGTDWSCTADKSAVMCTSVAGLLMGTYCEVECLVTDQHLMQSLVSGTVSKLHLRMESTKVLEHSQGCWPGNGMLCECMVATKPQVIAVYYCGMSCQLSCTGTLVATADRRSQMWLGQIRMQIFSSNNNPHKAAALDHNNQYLGQNECDGAPY